MTHRLLSRSILALLLIGGVTSGCASSGFAGSTRDLSGDNDEILTITVRNQQLEEARVYLWVDGQRERLGSVRSNASEVFHHPIDAIRAVQMEFDVILGPRCITPGVSLGPGDDVDAIIPSQLVAFAGNCR
ncbi:MAG: hypothetical protein P8L45_03770 [Longimicrobiales bacterium]|nr:hypothetical protein [Longimicrobiales bacterium]